MANRKDKRCVACQRIGQEVELRILDENNTDFVCVNAAVCCKTFNKQEGYSNVPKGNSRRGARTA